jgi:hypothetical protein
MFQPVVEALRRVSNTFDIRVISLCEFRGLTTPVELFNQEEVRIEKIIRTSFRRGSAGSQKRNVGYTLLRRLARKAAWSLTLRKRLQTCFETRPDLVVLPNDAAFPYDRICRLLKDYAIPFILVQEGVRFPLPNAEGDEYGRNGASAIAAWGENSSDFFLRQGVKSETIHLTGNPRYDSIWRADWNGKAEELRRALDLEGARILALFTNPIDDQGFCTTRGKLDLVRTFVDRLEPLFDDPEFLLIIKLHGREEKDDYDEICLSSPHAGRIRVLQGGSTYSVFSVATASIVFASSVGLEALLFGSPLGVLEIPGYGFVYDYVSSGAAVGIYSDNNRIRDQIELLMKPDARREEQAKQYVRRNLVCLGAATERVTELLLDQLRVREMRK